MKGISDTCTYLDNFSNCVKTSEKIQVRSPPYETCSQLIMSGFTAQQWRPRCHGFESR